MQDGGWVPRGPPGLIYSSESSQLWGPEQQACQPTGGFDWRSCTTSTPHRCHSYRGRRAKVKQAALLWLGRIRHHPWVVLGRANKDDGGGE